MADKNMQGTKRLMAALGRMAPKQQKDMKLGRKTSSKNAASLRRRGASAKPKNA
jgi:hypothetical protein